MTTMEAALGRSHVLACAVCRIQLTRGGSRIRWLGYQITGVAWHDAPDEPSARIEWTVVSELSTALAADGGA